jgi:hypothetical protein
MDETGEPDAGNVTTAGEHAFEVPDRLLRMREMLGQEAAAVLLGEESVEAPEAFRLRADVEQIDHQQVAGLGTLHADRTRQEMHRRQVDVADVVGAVVVLDEPAGPVVGLEDEVVAGLDPASHRHVRMPAVVDVLVLVRRLLEIDLDQGFRHGLPRGQVMGGLVVSGCRAEPDGQTDRYCLMRDSSVLARVVS